MSNSIYLLSGTNFHSKEKRIEEIKKNFLKNEITALNFIAFHADSHTAISVIEEILSQTLFLSKKLVLLRDISAYKTDGKKTLIEYSKNPSQINLLILTYQERPSKESWYKELASNSIEEVFWPYKKNEIERIISKMLFSKNKKIESNALEFLCEYFLNRNLSIDKEIDVLCSYISSKEIINIDDVKKMFYDFLDTEIYSWIEDIISERYKKSIGMISKFTDSDINRISYILHILASKYMRMIKFKMLIEEGKSSDEAQKELKVVKFLEPNFVRNCDRHDTNKINLYFSYLLQADLEIKKSLDLPRNILEKLIVSISINKSCF